MYELFTLGKAIQEREWTVIGTYNAKIISDIVFKSPIIKSWNYKNSDVINEEWGEPMSLAEGFLPEINEFLQFFGFEPYPMEDEYEMGEEGEGEEGEQGNDNEKTNGGESNTGSDEDKPTVPKEFKDDGNGGASEETADNGKQADGKDSDPENNTNPENSDNGKNDSTDTNNDSDDKPSVPADFNDGG